MSGYGSTPISRVDSITRTPCDHLGPNYQKITLLFLSTVLTVNIILPATYLDKANAQGTPITSSGLNTQISNSVIAGGTTQYEISGGTRPEGGLNLFHSFGEFNVPQNSIAKFLNNTGLDTANILGRVTGGNLSNIFGTIDTTAYPGANLFLMNPAGFLFGPNASLQVGGLVSFTSADYLGLADNVRFNATPNTAADALLTASNVASFGFLGSHSGPITIEGSHLTVANDTGISLVGGDVTIKSGILDNGTVQRAQLSSPNGKIQLASTKSPGVLDTALQPLTEVNGPSFQAFGSATFGPNSTVNITGPSTVSIQGGQFILNVQDAVLTTAQNNGQPGVISLNHSTIISSTSGGTSGGNILLKAEALKLDNTILSTAGAGNVGNILVEGNTLQTESSLVTSATVGQPGAGNGKAGTIELRIDQTANLKNTLIDSQTITNSDAGTIKVTAGSLTLASSQLTTGTTPNSGFTGGHAGNITVTVGTLTMNDSLIESQSSFSAGNAGAVDINATMDVTASGTGVLPFAVSTSTEGAPPFCPGTCGAGGLIAITAPTIELNGVGLHSTTTGTGNAGNIHVTTENLRIINGANITASAEGPVVTGASGAVTIHHGLTSPAQSVLIDGVDSGIFTNTHGTGAGGNVFINANSVTLQDGGKISANTSGPGDAGSITVSAHSLTIASGGRVEASTSSIGKGGSIAIETTGDVTVTGLSANGQGRSGIFAKTLSGGGSGSGSGGESGGSGGGSGSGVSKPGEAGEITIKAKNLFLNGGAQIDSSTTSGGTGGKVSITTTENITIAGSSTRLTSDATRGNGKGGSLTLVAKNITVQDNASVTAATGGKGDAGDISLTALNQLLLQSAGTVTTSTSGSGKGGTIIIQANQVLLDGQGTHISADTLPPFADMIITIKILHPNVSDLVVRLESPTGTRVALLSLVGENGANFIGTQLSDSAPTQITSGSAPFAGTFTPHEPLAQLNNELIAGNWALSVQDKTTGNVGSLESWTLQIGEQTFKSTGGPIDIPDNGPALHSIITVVNPTVPTVQGIGEAPGIGGNIVLTAGQSVMVSNGASVSASSTGSGNAGNISINAGQQFEMHDSSIATQATKASGGNIDIKAIDLISVTNSNISSSVQGGPSTSGGNITIDPKTVVLQNAQILASAEQGNGGNITITTPVFLKDLTSIVDASSRFGLSGTVTIQSPTSNLSGTVGQLASKTNPPQVLLQNRCVALAGGEQSTFILSGRDTLPAEPGGWLKSPMSMEHWTGVSLEHASTLMVQSQNRRSKTWPAMIMPKGEASVLSLRRLTPPGFLVRSFATPSTGCPS
jgi:filamentous hemagglutinin family protein